MTPDERALLVAVAWSVEKMATISGDQNMVATIHAAVQRYGATPIPVPLTPRPKYVRIEPAPAETRFTCQSCGDDGDFLVRIGEYYDPSALLCPTCIREAAALLDTME